MAYVGQVNFGLGQLVLVPGGANPTPIQIAVLSDISLDISYDMKELRGSYQFPIDLAKGAAKLNGKAKAAAISGAMLASVLSGSTSAAGITSGVAGEGPTAIPATPFQITVANSATFTVDLGVINTTNGKVMTRVASAPATGQYSVAAGVYTFATADTTNTVLISYAYTQASVGKTTSLTNQLMGQSQAFTLYVFNNYGGQFLGWKLPAVHLPKLAFALKAEAYTEEDVDFHCAVDSTSNKVIEFYSSASS